MIGTSVMKESNHYLLTWIGLCLSKGVHNNDVQATVFEKDIILG